MHRIRIFWQKGDIITNWDEICIWAIEQFGLPGTKFTSHPTQDYMDFLFSDERDAIHFSLRWS